MTEDKDPDDKRVTVYSHVAGYIVAPNLANFDKNIYPSRCDYAQAEFTDERRRRFNKTPTSD